MNLASVDRAFIATNVQPRGAPEVPNNPGNALCRFQFLEVIVRLGSEKYKSPGYVKTFSEATYRLLHECVFAHYVPEPWQGFRDEHLWTLEVDDIFKANEENLKIVFSRYFTQIKKNMDLQDCYQLCFTDTQLGVKENDICMCFGMSKMTIKDEVLQQGNNYISLKFVEFLEFIGRIAHVKYKNQSDLNLETKLEFTLD